MAIQDSVTSWFIQNIVLPNAEDMRNPGYILSKFTDQGKTITLREFFFPRSSTQNSRLGLSRSLDPTERS